jgi:hypothetical protein
MNVFVSDSVSPAEEGGVCGVFYAALAAVVWPPDSADSADEDDEEDEDDAQTVILKSSPFSSPGIRGGKAHQLYKNSALSVARYPPFSRSLTNYFS